MKTTHCNVRFSKVWSGDQPLLPGKPTLLTGLAVVVAAACWTPCATRAAETGGESASDTLAEVVVTATRREEKLQNVPESVSALSGDSLQVLGDVGDDIKQLAFKVPSLNIESSNGRAFPRFYIRGYGNTDFHDFASQPVGLLYDDIVQENAALKGFPIFDQADVEVLRGPQGTLFGRNSPAGVVKLESAKPVIGETSGFFSISDGTYNSGVVQGVVNVPVSDQMAFRISVQGQHRDDWVNDPVNLTTLGGFNDWAARAQLIFKPTDTFTALLNVHGRDLTGSSTLFRANIIQPGSNALIPGFDPAAIYTDGSNSSNLQTVGANLHLTWALPNFTLQSITGYESILHYLAIGNITGGCGQSTAFGAPTNPQCYATFPSGSGPGVIPFSVETSAGVPSHTQLTQEFRVVSANEGPLKGQAGVFLFYENVTAEDDDYCAVGECVASAPLFARQDVTRTKQTNDAEAVFGSLDYKFTDAFTATAGVRYTADHRSMRSGFTDIIAPLFPPGNATTAPFYAGKSASNVSWDVSATYKVIPDVSLYARVATGFRAPTLGEPGAGIGIQTTRAETTISYEAGVKADMFDRRARVAFDGYYYDVSNQQLSAVGGASNVTQLVNAQHTIGYGSELDFEAHPMANLTFNVSGSLNITRIEDPSLVVAVGGGVPVGDALNQTYSLPGAFGPVYYAYINGNPLPQAAKWVGDVSLRYDIPLEASGKLYVYTDWSYRSGINFFLYESKEFDGPSLTQGGLRLGYEWADGKYDAAVFCRNCTNQIRTIGGIDFADLLGYINDPRIIGAQFRAKF